jgi:hypothetical protein
MNGGESGRRCWRGWGLREVADGAPIVDRASPAPSTSVEAMGARLHLGWSSPLPRLAAHKVRLCVSSADRCPLASSSTAEDSATVSSTAIERLAPRMQKPLRPPPAPRLTRSCFQPPPLRRARQKNTGK